MDTSPESLETLTAKAPQFTTVRLYGRPLDGPDGEYCRIAYAGYKVGESDVRLPTARVFLIRRSQILSEDTVSDYVSSGESIRYYDIPVLADVQEAILQQIHIGMEIAANSGGTVAGLVASPPQRPVADRSDLNQLSSLELRERIREVVAGVRSGRFEPRACSSIQQSYSWTGSWLFGPRPDNWGSDCDQALQ